MDLLRHEVPVLALIDQYAVDRHRPDRAVQPTRHVSSKILTLSAAHDSPVAFFQIGNAVGQRGQRQRVRADEHLALRHTRWRGEIRAARR